MRRPAEKRCPESWYGVLWYGIKHRSEVGAPHGPILRYYLATDDFPLTDFAKIKRKSGYDFKTLL